MYTLDNIYANPNGCTDYSACATRIWQQASCTRMHVPPFVRAVPQSTSTNLSKRTLKFVSYLKYAKQTCQTRQSTLIRKLKTLKRECTLISRAYISAHFSWNRGSVLSEKSTRTLCDNTRHCPSIHWKIVHVWSMAVTVCTSTMHPFQQDLKRTNDEWTHYDIAFK